MPTPVQGRPTEPSRTESVDRVRLSGPVTASGAGVARRLRVPDRCGSVGRARRHVIPAHFECTWRQDDPDAVADIQLHIQIPGYSRSSAPSASATARP